MGRLIIPPKLKSETEVEYQKKLIKMINHTNNMNLVVLIAACIMIVFVIFFAAYKILFSGNF